MKPFHTSRAGRAHVRRLAAVATIAATVATISACGSAGPEADETPGGLDRVVLGLPAISANAMPVYVGQDQGAFERNGIALEIVVLPQGGPATVPALVAGEVDFSFVTNASTILANDSRIPVKSVAPVESGGTDPAADPSQLVVLGESGIAKVGDLGGRTVAITSLKGIQELQTDAILRKAGLEPSAVQYVPIPLQQMSQALLDGQVDAAMVVEPFLTDLESKADLVSLAAGSVEVMDDMPGAVFITTDQRIAEDADLVGRFQRAIFESATYVQDNPDAPRAKLKELTEIDPALIDKMRLPQVATEFNVQGIQEMIDLMLEFEFITRELRAEEIITPRLSPTG